MNERKWVPIGDFFWADQPSWWHEGENVRASTMYRFHYELTHASAMDSIVLIQARPSTHHDIGPGSVIGPVHAVLYGHVMEALNREDGGPQMEEAASDVDPKTRAALEGAIRAYIGATTNMEEACWVPTGVRVRLFRDGMVECLDD